MRAVRAYMLDGPSKGRVEAFSGHVLQVLLPRGPLAYGEPGSDEIVVDRILYQRWEVAVPVGNVTACPVCGSQLREPGPSDVYHHRVASVADPQSTGMQSVLEAAQKAIVGSHGTRVAAYRVLCDACPTVEMGTRMNKAK